MTEKNQGTIPHQILDDLNNVFSHVEGCSVVDCLACKNTKLSMLRICNHLNLTETETKIAMGHRWTHQVKGE